MVSPYPRPPLSSSEKKFREEVCQELCPKVRDNPKVLIEQWIKGFSHNHFQCASEEAESDILKYKEEALPLLVEATYSADGGMRNWAVHYLLKLADPRAREALIARLDDEWGATIIDAAECLFKMGDSEIAVARLVELFLDRSTHRHTRILAAEKLLELGVKKVIPEGRTLDFSDNVPENYHDQFKKLYQDLS